MIETVNADQGGAAGLKMPLVQQLQRTVRAQAAQIPALQAQIEWFKRQIFGNKSERFASEPDPQQMHLVQLLGEPPTGTGEPEATSDVPAHKRRAPRSDFTDGSASVPFFDRTKVPLQTIEVPNPEV